MIKVKILKHKDLKVMLDCIEDIYEDMISGWHCVNAKKSEGSTNPIMVAKYMKEEEKWLKTAYKEFDKSKRWH